MRVSWLWLVPGLALGSLVGYLFGSWLLPRYGTAAMWMMASALTALALGIVILYLVWQQE